MSDGLTGQNRPTTDRQRLFIALPVPEAIKAEMAQLQLKLRSRLPDGAVGWASPEQIHLTLVFLGNVDATCIEQLTTITREVCTDFPPMRLRAERIGFFPHAQSPRVIWVWTHDDWGDLTQLQKALTTATNPFNESRDKESFTAHLTVGRVRKLTPTEIKTLAETALEMEGKVFGDWTSDTVEIMRSEPSAGGHRHGRVAQIPLKGRMRE